MEDISRRNALKIATGMAATLTIGTTTGAAQEDREKWVFETNDSVDSSPTVVDGTVFVGTGAANLHAVDTEDGEQQWKFETGGFSEVFLEPPQ